MDFPVYDEDNDPQTSNTYYQEPEQFTVHENKAPDKVEDKEFVVVEEKEDSVPESIEDVYEETYEDDMM